MARDFEFAAHYNARVHGMKSALFSRAQLEDLLEQEELNILIEVLLNSPYEKEMAESLTRYEGADAVEDAASRNMAQTFGRLLKYAQGPFAELAKRLFARWDLMAVKTLLRVKHQGLDRTRATGALLPGPNMTPALLNHLVGLESVEVLVQQLVGWNPALCACLGRALPHYQESRMTAVFEDALDRAYFVDGAAQLSASDDEDSECVRRFLQMEIDRINLRSVFQLRGGRGSEADVVERLLPGGTVRQHVLRQMAQSRDVAEAMEYLGPTRYSELVEGLYQYLQTRRFSPLERMFEMVLMRELKRMARVHVFSIAVVMHYVWLKYNEVTNLRLIARGEARHLPRGRVREEMVYA